MSSPARMLAAFAAILTCGATSAGEILILQPATTNERAAQQLNERARQQSGQPVTEGVVYVLDPATGMFVPATGPGQAEQLRREARDRLEASESGTAGDGSQVILRAAPLTEAERMRLKARAYVPEGNKPSSRNCSTASNQVGTIGEGAGAHKSENVIEKGGGAVNPNCR
ncbi:MAG: hypothetical protein AB1642_01280 [Pseudomonadota bacterium]